MRTRVPPPPRASSPLGGPGGIVSLPYPHAANVVVVLQRRAPLCP